MRHIAHTTFGMLVVCGISIGAVACSDSAPVAPTSTSMVNSSLAVVASRACWGQASAVFAKMGEMGQHASQEETPRLGLHNLAQLLYDDGVIADNSLQALGAFLAEQYGLSIDACM